MLRTTAFSIEQLSEEMGCASDYQLTFRNVLYAL